MEEHPEGKQEAEESVPAGRADIRRYRRNLQEEIDNTLLYKALARTEKDPERRAIFQELAEIEEEHAVLWRGKLKKAGVTLKERPSPRARFFVFLSRLFGSRSMVPVAQILEMKAGNSYAGQQDAAELGIPQEERMHAKVFAHMRANRSTSVVEHESWHRGGGGGSLRAAVFGINDGLISNFSLIMGVAGGTGVRASILLAGFAGMLAGAFSMAAGEYVSMKSQRELFERELRQEEEELEASPEDEAKELELIYRAKGIDKEQAAGLARTILENPESALDTLAREELGLDPSELGSPWGAAISSFLAFVAGAIVPLAPFLFPTLSHAVWLSAGLSGAALFFVGAMLSIFTGRGAFFSGLRMLLIGSAVALVTHSIGLLVGHGLS
ncbi:MAG: VIT1/CCC1 transporter family protein [Acidobacteriota bacterium]|jgi:vacuolar iron transporter family protein